MNYPVSMKRKLGILSVVVLGLLFIPATQAGAAISSGAKCTKAGIKQVYKGKTYTCIKTGKKLVWNKGVPILPSAASPSPSPTLIVLKGCTEKPVYKIGDVGPGCGVIFYDAGSSQPWGRFLEVISWKNPDFAAEVRPYIYTDTGYSPTYCLEEDYSIVTLNLVPSIEKSRAIGSGRSNTESMATNCKWGIIRFVTDLKFGGKDDWFLPSLDEAALLSEKYFEPFSAPILTSTPQNGNQTPFSALNGFNRVYGVDLGSQFAVLVGIGQPVKTFYAIRYVD